MEDRISATITDENVAGIKATVQTLRDQMPFLKEFTPAQIAEMPKMGSKSLDFVQTAVDAAEVCKDELPRRFDVAAFKADVQAYTALNAIRNALEPVWRELNDTLIAVGADSYEASLEVYHSLKRAAPGSGAEVYVDRMSKRFSSSGSSGQSDPSNS